MAGLADDIVTLIASAGLGKWGTDVFTTGKSSVPTGNGPFTSVRETGGTGLDNTQNDNIAYERQTAQILTRALSPAIALAKIKLIRSAVCIRNTTVNGTWYIHIRPIQSGFVDMGVDDEDRQQYEFNVLGWKRPS